MPTMYNYFATWDPSKIWVNGEEVVPMVGSHTMFSEQARGPDGRIQNGSGVLYSPMAQVKTGFVSPNETEFHFVAHTSSRTRTTSRRTRRGSICTSRMCVFWRSPTVC